MGNNFSCNEFYCQSIESKPEWFSENNYLFFYKNNFNQKNISNFSYSQNNNNNTSNNNSKEISNNILTKSEDKPFKIDKGIITLFFNHDFHLLIHKKLDIDSSVNKFLIPFNFSLNFPHDLHFFIILSDFIIDQNNYHLFQNISNSKDFDYNIFIQNDQKIFILNIFFHNFNIIMDIPFSNKQYKGKIKNKKKYHLSLSFENDFHNPHQFISNISFESNKKNILKDSFPSLQSSSENNNNNNNNNNNLFLTFLLINNNLSNNKNTFFSFFLD